MHQSADVVVVGAGSTGTSIAWQLGKLKAGRVLLLDKAGVAAGGTGRSSGIVRTHYLHETLARLALKARGVFERFDEIVGGECGFHQVGFLVPVGPHDVEAMSWTVAMNRRAGIESHLLTAEEGRELEPRMRWDDIAVAAWEPLSGYADPAATASAYAAAARREGVGIRIGAQVIRILARDDAIAGLELAGGEIIETSTVVIAAGYRSRELVAPLGIDLPLTPVRHDIVIVRRSPAFGKPHAVISDRLLGAYHLPQEAELTMIGTNGPGDAVDPEVEIDKRPRSPTVEWHAGRFLDRFPDEEDAAVQGGFSGTYDVSPDVQPILGPVDGIAGLQVAAGFSGHGFKLSPVVGQLIAETIVNGTSSIGDINFFRLSRFAEGKPITLEHPYTLASLG